MCMINSGQIFLRDGGESYCVCVCVCVCVCKNRAKFGGFWGNLQYFCNILHYAVSIPLFWLFDKRKFADNPKLSSRPLNNAAQFAANGGLR